jgi:hypothetical protein
MEKVTIRNMRPLEAIKFEGRRVARTVKGVVEKVKSYKRPQGSLQQRQRAWNESATGRYPRK